MPYSCERVPMPKSLDRRIKLTDAQKVDIHILHHKEGYGIRELTRLYKVSRRLIQFICYPERLKRNIELRKKRGGSKQYYDKEKHRQYMKNHRRYKHRVINKKDCIYWKCQRFNCPCKYFIKIEG